MKELLTVLHPHLRAASGYLAIHLPTKIVKQYNINPGTAFLVSVENGRIIMEQQTQKEENHA